MDLLAESITEVTVSGKITNTDRVLSFISLPTTLMKIIYNVLMLLPAKMLTLK